MKEKKQHCFHLDLSRNHRAPGTAHTFEGGKKKSPAIIPIPPSLDFNVDFVDSTGSQGAEEGR